MMSSSAETADHVEEQRRGFGIHRHAPMGSRHSMDIRPIRQKNTPSTMVPVLGPDGRITSSPSVLPMRTCLEGRPARLIWLDQPI